MDNFLENLLASLSGLYSNYSGQFNFPLLQVMEDTRRYGPFWHTF